MDAIGCSVDSDATKRFFSHNGNEKEEISSAMTPYNKLSAESGVREAILNNTIE